ncbi:MAG: M23 family metallopeptidase [Clostridia bacterium]|nr:M23 family metallopeptidase [Clostridia bacterium]
MNAINHTIRTVTDTVYVNTVDDYGNPITVEQTVTRRILSITVTHKSYEDMILAYGFNEKQKEQLYLLNDEKNKDLWDELLAGLIDNGTGEILTGSSARVPNNIFSWPLEEAGRITSYFGYRNDPFTGRVSYHCGTDIAMPSGTPILAAADGTVTVANSTDSWGGSYGYYVKIHHNDTYDSLYAHCSSICVTYGQTVQKGQVIGYVGTTGNSTGNHLHFEIWKNGSRTNALDYFE